MADNHNGDNNWQDFETQWQQPTAPPRRFDPLTGEPLTRAGDQQAHAAQQSSQSSSRRKPGLAGVASVAVIVLAALVGFGLVWFFNKSKDHTSDTLPQTVNQAPVHSQSSSPTSSSTSSTPTSSSSTSDVTADFPGNAGTNCTQGGSIDSSSVRVDGVISCAMANAVAGEVDNRVAADPTVSNFDFDQDSPITHKTFHLSCSRQDHLTTCSTPDQIKGHSDLLYFYVKG